MEATVESDWSIAGILGAARGNALGTDAEAIGTEHLLAGITAAKGAAREALADEGATKTALLAVLRDRTDRDDAWNGTDDVAESVAAQDVLGTDADKRVRFTGAAGTALTAAMTQARRDGAAKFGAVQLLRALLAADNRAVELLNACGIAPQTVLDRLDGGAGSQKDDLTPLLHPTRDILLGRAQYRHLSFWKRWLVKSSGANLASMPARWVAMETYEQARRLGNGAVGTEHVLLAILATHEVALHYPHLTGQSADTRYTGGERLASLGIDYASVHKALTGDLVRLTNDARPAKQYIDETTSPDAASSADPGTGPLAETLLNEDTRARQLVDALKATPGE